MGLILIVSITIRLVSIGWSIFLLRRLRDWRVSFLTVMFVLMALRQIITLLTEKQSWIISITGYTAEIPGLAVSIMAFMSVFFLERMIMAWRQTDLVLQESEARYRSLTNDVLDSSGVGIIILDSDFKVVWVNQSLERYFGLRRGDIIGKDQRQLISQRIKDIFEDGEGFARKLMATYDDNTYAENFVCHVLHDGEREGRWLEHWSQPIQSGLYAGGRIEHYYDITERKNAEAALRERELVIQSLITHAPYSIWVCNREGTIIYANQAALDLFGVTDAAQIIGRYNIYRDTTETEKSLLKYFERAWAGEIVHYSQDLNMTTVRYDTSCQETLHFHTTLFAIPSNDGQQPNIVVIQEDITEKVKAEEHIQHLQNVLMAIRNVNQLIVREKNPQKLLQGTCDILSRAKNYKLVWIGLIEEGTKEVLPIAQMGFEESYLKSIKITWDDSETGKGPTGTAIKTGKPSVMRDIDSDPRYKPWREEAMKRGYVSSVAVPLLYKDKVFGALNVYATNSNAFDEEEIDLLVEVSQDIAFALHNIGIEEDIIRTKELLQSIIDNTSDLVCTIDLEGNFLSINRAVTEQLGYEEEDLIGKPKEKLAVDPELFEKSFREVLEKGNLSNLEVPFRRKDGSIADILYSVTLLRDKDGHPVAVAGFGKDITERKRAEKALQQYAERLQILREMDQAILAVQSPEAIAGIALSRFRQLIPCLRASVLEFNLETQEAIVLAVHTDDETTVRAGTRFPLDDLGASDDFLQKQIHIVEDTRTLSQPPSVVQSLHAEGVRSYINIPLFAQDQLIGALNIGVEELTVFTREQIEIAREVADQLAVVIQQARLHQQIRRRIKELTAIHKAGQRLQRLYTPDALAQEIIAVLEKTLNYDYGAVLLLDESDGQLVPFALSDQGHGSAFIEEDKAYVASHHIREGMGITGWVASTGQSICIGDVRNDNRYYALRNDIRSELCVPMRIGDKIIGVVNVETTKLNAYTKADKQVLETVSAQIAVAIQNARLYEQIQRYNDELEQQVAERTKELAHANLQLKEIDRLKSEFIATMSHELRTPLNSIIGFTGIILKGITGEVNEEQKKQLSMVYNSSKHLLSLINDILDLSRIESGKMEVSIKKFKVQDVISEVSQTLYPMISQKGLRLLTDITDETAEIYSDRKKVYQILLNLANNAVKFTEKGEIKIEAKLENETLQMRVSDTGIGIKKEDLDYLFEAFRQIDATARRRYQGAGLGLYLCKKLVTLLGGDIRAESQYGKGSKFTFTLPIRNEQEGHNEKKDINSGR